MKASKDKLLHYRNGSIIVIIILIFLGKLGLINKQFECTSKRK